MKFVRITESLWINLEKADSIFRNDDGTATIQLGENAWKSELPFEAIIMQTFEHEKLPEPPAIVQSPLIQPTEPAW